MIRLWDVQSGKEIKKFEGHVDGVNSVQFSFDGQMIVSSSYDTTIALWNVKAGERLKELKGHSGTVMYATFSPDDKCVLSASNDTTIRIWDVESGKELKKLEGHKKIINNVKYSSNGQTIISCSNDKTIRLWDVKTGYEIQNLEVYLDQIARIDISPDDDKIILHSINLYEICNQAQIEFIELKKQFILCLHFFFKSLCSFLKPFLEKVGENILLKGNIAYMAIFYLYRNICIRIKFLIILKV
ncbi:hypothetical protein RFI_18775 [Reticulomyxa filosa]|uniref:Uncharacterized protein n=1 Tax=Reticulomyxa filosa TaxID=46433 RepID=X6MWW0_RETFI|nr:hypothetical protein RFI_18775 [Reticulomyxa filosa]|eukprot:ETO18488.1 hypothetical protein RFI_18775 [Reticulomyxa filosa]